MQYLYDRLKQSWNWLARRRPTRLRIILAASSIAVLAAGLTIILSCHPIWQRRETVPPQVPTIRARLAEGRNQLHVSSASTASWSRKGTGEMLLSGTGPWQVKATPGGIQIGNHSIFGSAVVLREQENQFQLGDRTYRGKLVVNRTDSGLTAINSLTVEQYLYGVVPSEMPASWPSEALAAQAVAARTYVLDKLRRTSGDSWNLKALDLAYRGTEREDPRAIKAVQETAGVVLHYGGKVFPAYFHSTCGGHTAPADKVFDRSSIPPLAGVPCDWCRDSSYYTWSTRMDAAELTEELSARGIQSINSLELEGRGTDGHARSVVVNGTRINANAFRLAIGPQKLRSTNFTIQKSGNTYLFSGHGWGHGVGLCQWGARGVAKSGTGWRGILKHYYPEATLQTAY